MCTALTYQTRDLYFGRNLDLEYSYHETVTVTPRAYPFRFYMTGEMTTHHAMIGMAYVVGGYPLYYDAVNEHGLAMAGLNFPGNACYAPVPDPARVNLASFELIPYLLGQYRTVAQVKEALEGICVTSEAFAPELPPSPLHWMIADREGQSIVVEPTAAGLMVYDNPVGVMTNNPPFDRMLDRLTDYRDLSPLPSVNRLAPEVDLPVYCQGLGARGLPGDCSSVSRFVRAVYLKMHAVSDGEEASSVGQFFHLLSGVEMVRGAVRLPNGKCDMTVYTCCCNLRTGVYYYTTYGNRRITAVDLHAEKLDGTEVISYPLAAVQDIAYVNREGAR